jgi:hypothetical protein
MPSKIILKKSSVASKAPVAGDLDFGELAINYTDSKLYFKKADGSIDAFTSSAAAAPVTSVGSYTGDVTATNLLDAIKTVDGAGSGLDADTLDGLSSASFYLASNPNGYTSNTGTVTSVATNNGLTGGTITTTGTIGLTGQALALHNLATNGIIARTAAGTVSARILTAGTGISITNGDGVSGNPTITATNNGTVTSVGGTGAVSGITLSGTVTTTGNLTLGGTLSASISNISDATRWWNNFGDNHSTRTSFDATTPSYGFGWRYVRGTTNGPNTGGTQYYSMYTGVGNDYPATGSGSYGMYIAIDRDSTTPYLSVRYNESNSLSTWRRINAGGADTWTTARTLTVGNTGKSVNGSANVSWSLAEIGAYAATNPSGYTSNTGTVTSVGATSPLVSSGGNTPSISIPAATASADGYMSSAYASKLDGIAAGATANTGTVTSIVAGTGLSGGTITTSGTIALENTTVTAGSYTFASITVDAQGRLTSASSGQSPSAFPAGTVMLFVQTSAPTGWTKSTAHNNKALRIVSGTAGSGGSVAFTTAFSSGLAAGSTTLDSSQIPGHRHEGGSGAESLAAAFGRSSSVTSYSMSLVNQSRNLPYTSTVGGGGSHNHTLPNFQVAYVDAIIATKD